MSAYAPDKAATVVPFAPTPKGQQPEVVADESGRTIVALLQKAAEMAKEDCARAMDLAHKLSFQLRASEERGRELEAEVAHFRDRATRAEAWLLRIHNEVEQTFFSKKSVSRARLHGRSLPTPRTGTGNRSRKTSPPASRREPSLLSFPILASMKCRTVAWRALGALAWLAFAAAPSPAMVGGALPADQTIARHVVLIIGGNNVCTGVAVAPDLVLTAAHCVLTNGKYRLVVFDGRRPAVKDIASVAPHPQFSPRADAPDLALVKLAAAPAPNLAPAAFSERRTPPAVGDRFIVAGFGVAVQGDRKTAGKLRAVTLVATDRPSSQQLSLVDPQKLGETAGLGVCNGDSGGPVFDARDHALIGIVSWTARADGEPACGFVSGVIPLARYRYWILETAARLGSPLEP